MSLTHHTLIARRRSGKANCGYGENINAFKEAGEDVQFTRNPDLIEEAKRCLTVISKNFKGFLVGLYRSPRVKNIIYIILIAAALADAFEFKKSEPQYQNQIIQSVSDYEGWTIRSQEEARIEFQNKFIMLNNEHVPEAEENALKDWTTISSISGSYVQVFDHYRNI